MPKRYQRSRAKGYQMPPNTVSVARPSRFSNRWRIGEASVTNVVTGESIRTTTPRETSVALFELWLRQKLQAEPDFLAPLYGKNLACYCQTDVICHADVLLYYARQPHPAAVPTINLWRQKYA